MQYITRKQHSRQARRCCDDVIEFNKNDFPESIKQQPSAKSPCWSYEKRGHLTLMMQPGSSCENAFTDDSPHVLHDHSYNQTAVISTGIPNSRNSEEKENNDGIHWQTVTGSFKRPRKLVSIGPDISKKLCSNPSSF
ncbi:hypothetical protein J6590_060158 [Homalodisca vitripennis]|nr:hypothetical protein J6590_060158 [Homalodisca vitripennis]